LEFTKAAHLLQRAFDDEDAADRKLAKVAEDAEQSTALAIGTVAWNGNGLPQCAT